MKTPVSMASRIVRGMIAAAIIAPIFAYATSIGLVDTVRQSINDSLAGKNGHHPEGPGVEDLGKVDKALRGETEKMKKRLEERAAERKAGKKPKKQATSKKGKLTKKQRRARRALRVLGTLAVKGRAPMTGYDRDEFGPAWSDSAGNFGWTRNGCDTRNDVLKRDLVKVTFKRGGKSCAVATGVLKYEKYTGQRNYRFDSTDGEYSTDLDIEHVVALGNVWVTGGQKLSDKKRAAIANDPINLFAADPSSNRQKGDADFATWLPKNKAFRCTYALKQIRVKKKYHLWVTKPEKAAMKKVLRGCR